MSGGFLIIKTPCIIIDTGSAHRLAKVRRAVQRPAVHTLFILYYLLSNISPTLNNAEEWGIHAGVRRAWPDWALLCLAAQCNIKQ